MNANLDELLDSQAVAKRLGVKIGTLEVWRCRGTGPTYVRVGRLPRYRVSDVEHYLQVRTVSPVTA
ncbi:MAG: helix-turn-helix domain-containing protein [Gammaproteobacteria bacterium]